MAKSTQSKTKGATGTPRRVDFVSNNDDWELLQLLHAGMSTRFIARVMGLTMSQVDYRARLSGVFRKDYRDGDSRVAQHVLRTLPSVWSQRTARATRKEANQNLELRKEQLIAAARLGRLMQQHASQESSRETPAARRKVRVAPAAVHQGPKQSKVRQKPTKPRYQRYKKS